MHENEVKAIAEAVVKVLAERGLLKSGGCGCSPKEKPEPKAAGAFAGHTTGTAGKVFGAEWSPRKYGSPTVPGDPLPAPGTAGRGIIPAEGDHTHSDDCPHCRAASGADPAGLKALGADRVGVCHPTKKSCGAIARMVDHTLLKPGATQEEVAKLCEEARAFCFASVCVNPAYVPLAAKLLKGSGVKVCTVVGFPLGSTTPTVKALEARDAIANGAEEIDMVLNVGALKSGNDALVREDIRAVREATRGRVLKVILETALLSKEEKVRACRASKEAGADFVKTSTGFGPGGATAEDIRLMRETVGPTMGVKASGGIRDTAAAKAMIEAGATRLGTSASVAIVTDAKAPGGSKGY